MNKISVKELDHMLSGELLSLRAIQQSFQDKLKEYNNSQAFILAKVNIKDPSKMSIQIMNELKNSDPKKLAILSENITAEQLVRLCVKIDPTLVKILNPKPKLIRGVTRFERAPKIQESPYLHHYQKIQEKVIANYPQKPEIIKKLQRCKSRECTSNKLCTFQRLQPDFEPSIYMSQPSQFGNFTNESLMLNHQFAETDFPDKNLALKNHRFKIIATEEALDDWQAQSLGITAEKLSRSRKYFKTFKNEENEEQKQTTFNQLIKQSRSAGYFFRVEQPTDFVPKIYDKNDKVQSAATAPPKKENKSPIKQQEIDRGKKNFKYVVRQTQKMIIQKKRENVVECSQKFQNESLVPKNELEIYKKQKQEIQQLMIENFEINKQRSKQYLEKSRNYKLQNKPYTQSVIGLPVPKFQYVTALESDVSSIYTEYNDTTQNWHHRQFQNKELALKQSIHLDHQLMRITQSEQIHHDLVYQPFRNVGSENNMQMDSIENKYQIFTKSVKGKDINSKSISKIRRISQENCFKAQKQSILQMVSKKLKSNNSVAEIQEPTPPDHVLELIENDNQRDIENPFVLLNQDLRVNKTNILTKMIEPDKKLLKQKLSFQNGDFWFLKGYNQMLKSERDSAIDSFRQAIRLNTKYSEAMHNLGCAYELQQRFEMGQEWFKEAYKLKREHLQSYMGFALCNFKQGKVQKAIKALDIAIEILDDVAVKQARKQMEEHYKLMENKTEEFKQEVERKMRNRIIYRENYQYRYVRSMCYRTVGEFEKAKQDYVHIVKAFEINEGTLISKNIFGMIMMPMEQNRKKLLRLVDQFRSLIDKYQNTEIDRKIITKYYLDFIDKTQVYVKENKSEKWLDKKIFEAIQVFETLSFFKRFKQTRIREMMEHMELTVVPMKEVIFFMPGKVYVMISGAILMQNHEQNTISPINYARFTQGDIMNFLQEKSKQFNSIETWFQAQVESEVAIFDKSYFEQVWTQDLMTDQLLLKRYQTMSFPVFSNLSELLVTSMVTEYLEIKKFNAGDVLYKQSKYSPSNSYYRQFYNNHFSKFDEQVTYKRMRKRQFEESSPTTRIQMKLESEDRKVETVKKVKTLDIKKVKMGHCCHHDKIEVQEGFYLILDGSCIVRNHDDKYVCKKLKRSDFFGESDILKIIGFDFFGDIITETPIVCYFISKDNFNKIPLYEQNMIKKYAESREVIKLLSYEYSQRYKIDIEEYNDYYS